MTRLMFGALVLLGGCRANVGAPTPTTAIGVDIGVLAGQTWEGRETGTAGADSAGDFLVRRYEALGLRPAFRLQCDAATDCPKTYRQSFEIGRGVALGHNVAGVVEGSDALVRRQFVVIGAHYDALGRSPALALDRHKGFVIRPGADDNASGTAAVLELARRLRDRPTRRSVVLVNFDAEEIGLIGSRVFLRDAPVPREAVTFMLNLDMIGRLRENHLLIEGVQDSATRAVIGAAIARTAIRAEYVASTGRSDQASFLAEHIQAVALSTGYHADYHTMSDVVARLDLDGIERIVDLAELIVRHAANR